MALRNSVPIKSKLAVFHKMYSPFLEFVGIRVRSLYTIIIFSSEEGSYVSVAVLYFALGS